jgi:hypothetical protein
MLERAWAILSPPRLKELESYPLDLTFDGVACRVALDTTGVRHLLIPTVGETVAVDSRPAVLGMAVRRLVFGGAGVVYVDVSCSEAELYPEFDEVVADVLEEVAGSERPASVAVRAVGRWRKLFAARLVRGMSKPAKLGLFAELSLLSHLLDAQPSFPLENWRGPLREPHDFEAPTRCLEVKALGAMAESVVIHGLDQLDTHDGRPLDLILVRVVDDPGGLTIGDLVDDVRDSTAPAALLRSRLAAAGWSSDPQRPDLDAFAVQEVLRVTVDGTVPRLVSASLTHPGLPAGLHDLSYHLDVDALLPTASSASLAHVAEEAIR